jgi:hypothetical protein
VFQRWFIASLYASESGLLPEKSGSSCFVRVRDAALLRLGPDLSRNWTSQVLELQMDDLGVYQELGSTRRVSWVRLASLGEHCWLRL